VQCVRCVFVAANFANKFKNDNMQVHVFIFLDKTIRKRYANDTQTIRKRYANDTQTIRKHLEFLR
jgi:hypothetical protein